MSDQKVSFDSIYIDKQELEILSAYYNDTKVANKSYLIDLTIVKTFNVQ